MTAGRKSRDARTAGGVPKWITATARTVRSSSRLSSATDRAIGAVRGNAVLIDVARRVFAWDAPVPVMVLAAGRPLAGMDGTERLPIVVIDAIGSGASLPHILREVAVLQGETRGFRPVLLLDQPEFAAVRAFGYPVELVIPEAEWDFAGEWADYRARRLAMMLVRYAALSIVGVTDGQLDPVGRRLLASLASYRPWEVRTT